MVTGEVTQAVTSTDQQITMQERQCPECGRPFRAMTSSLQVFCSSLCRQESPLKDPRPKVKKNPWDSLKKEQQEIGHGVKRKPNPGPRPQQPKVKAMNLTVVTVPEAKPKPKPNQVETKPIVKVEVPIPLPTPAVEDDIETRWKTYVQHAKKYVKLMNRSRMAVATLAIKACDIQWGGGNHWKKFEGVYTIKAFAQEIGVHPKTLSEWCAVKRLIADKLPEGVFSETNYMAAWRTRQKINRKSTKEEVTRVYNEELNREQDSYYFYQSLKRMKTTRHLILKKLDLNEIDPEELAEMKSLTLEIAAALAKHLDGSNQLTASQV